MMDLPIQALAVRQPWAWAIFQGKDIENRSKGFFGKQRHSAFIGRIAILASKGMTQDEYREGAATIDAILGEGACPKPADLIRGAIIGTVSVTNVVSKSRSPWFFGPFGLVLDCADECTPIACTGALGYFNWQANSPKLGGPTEEPLRWMTQWGVPSIEPKGSLL